MWKFIGKEVIEGRVYIVHNFIIRDAVGNLKLVSSDICLRFSNATNFAACADDIIIPLYKFEIFDLADILTEAFKLGENENPEFVIGIFMLVVKFSLLVLSPNVCSN